MSADVSRVRLEQAFAVTPTIGCNLAGCGRDAATTLAEFGDFPVCAAHDTAAVRSILSNFVLPTSFWYQDELIALPSAVELTEAHLTHRARLGVRPT